MMKVKLVLAGLTVGLMAAAPVAAENRVEVQQNKFVYQNTGNNLATRGGWLKTGNATASVQLRNQLKEEIRQKMEEIKQLREEFRETFRSRVWGMVARVRGELKAKTSDQSWIITVEGKDITLNLADKTRLRRRFFGRADLEEIQPGDQLEVIGRWTGTDQTAMDALFIRDLSIQKVHGVLVGKITSVNGQVINLDTIARGPQTVTVGETTKYVNREETAITLADLKVGHRIRVKGIWNRTTRSLIEVAQIKDYDLPVRESSQD